MIFSKEVPERMPKIISPWLPISQKLFVLKYLATGKTRSFSGWILSTLLHIAECNLYAHTVGLLNNLT